VCFLHCRLSRKQLYTQEVKGTGLGSVWGMKRELTSTAFWGLCHCTENIMGF